MSDLKNELRQAEVSVLDVDYFQKAVFDVITGVFADATEPGRRLRAFEEMVELIHAWGYSEQQLVGMFRHVSRNEPGEVTQEMAGVNITLLAYAEVIKQSLSDLTYQEIKRVVSKREASYAKHIAKPNEDDLAKLGE